jgi:hypothetical protein
MARIQTKTVKDTSIQSTVFDPDNGFDTDDFIEDIETTLKNTESTTNKSETTLKNTESTTNKSETTLKNTESTTNLDMTKNLQEQLRAFSKLSKNAEKMLNAIRSEIINQSCGSPKIGFKTFVTKYKVHKNYVKKSALELELKGHISKREAIYNGEVKTFEWSILS